MPRTGVWLVGARGSVATTAVVGALALSQGLSDRTGLVCELPALKGTGVPDLADLVFGGHDVVTTSLPKRAEMLADAGVVPTAAVRAVEAGLAEVDARLRQVVTDGGERDQAGCAERIAADLHEFAAREGCERVVVVNVSSTEPPARRDEAHHDLDALERAMSRRGDVLPDSSLFAYAAFRAGASFVDFTPSTGARLPALEQLALREGVPWAGSDGKTGETLLKAALAPMFAERALRVRSWAGTNLLGGGDGASLADPDAARSKSISKGRVLREVLGYDVDAPVHIDHVADLGDWKTAWDHVSFEGFLGTRMTMQFTWQGCDSALAAPLVLDLARLLARAHEVGETGPQADLAFFFKDPVGTDEHRLAAQFDALVAWAGRLGAV